MDWPWYIDFATVVHLIPAESGQEVDTGHPTCFCLSSINDIHKVKPNMVDATSSGWAGAATEGSLLSYSTIV